MLRNLSGSQAQRMVLSFNHVIDRNVIDWKAEKMIGQVLSVSSRRFDMIEAVYLKLVWKFHSALFFSYTRSLIHKFSKNLYHLRKTLDATTWRRNQLTKNTTQWTSLSCGTVQSVMGTLTNLRTATSSEWHRTPTSFWAKHLWRHTEFARYLFRKPVPPWNLSCRL